MKSCFTRFVFLYLPELYIDCHESQHATFIAAGHVQYIPHKTCQREREREGEREREREN